MKKIYLTFACLSIIANLVLCKLYFLPAEYLPEEKKHFVCTWEMKKKTPDGVKKTSTIEIPVENYRPKRKHIEWLLSRSDIPLADWDYINLNPQLDISAIELIGFENSNQNESVHLIVEDSKYIEMFRKGMSWPWLKRSSPSDFTFYAPSTGCDPYGVVLIHTPKKKMVVGLSCFGFHLGSVHSGSRTAFESWLMAKAIDDILSDKIGRRLSEKTFNTVSGQAALVNQKNYYEYLTKPEAETASE